MTRPFHSNSQRAGRLRAFWVTATVMLCCLWTPTSSQAGELDFPSTDYVLRSIDGMHVIGRVHFTVTTADGLTTARGEYHFLDGNYDIDQSTVRPGVGGNLPTLVRTDHSFFFPGGAPDRESHVEFAAGTGTCTVYTNGKPTVTSANFDFPPDTFAGDTVILPLRRYVAAGANGSTSFHVFNCIPGPKLLKVTATAKNPAPWEYYSGNLVQVDVKPDFGWINIVIAPFLPQIRAWFEPAEDAFFVGGETARYYKGPKYMLVRVRPTNAEIKAAHGNDSGGVPRAQPTPRALPTS